MDMVSQTDQPGAAMEVSSQNKLKNQPTSKTQNWGLMIFDTTALLIDPDSNNDDDRQRTEIGNMILKVFFTGFGCLMWSLMSLRTSGSATLSHWTGRW